MSKPNIQGLNNNFNENSEEDDLNQENLNQNIIKDSIQDYNMKQQSTPINPKEEKESINISSNNNKAPNSSIQKAMNDPNIFYTFNTSQQQQNDSVFLKNVQFLDSENVKLREALSEMNNELKDKEEALNESQRILKKINDEYSQMVKEFKKMEEERNSLQEKNDNNQKMFDTFAKNLSDYEKIIKQNEQLKTELLKTKESMNYFKGNYNNKTNDFNKIEKDVKDKEILIKDLKIEGNKIINMLQDRELLIETYSKKIAELNGIIEQKNDQLKLMVNFSKELNNENKLNVKELTKQAVKTIKVFYNTMNNKDGPGQTNFIEIKNGEDFNLIEKKNKIENELKKNNCCFMLNDAIKNVLYIPEIGTNYINKEFLIDNNLKTALIKTELFSSLIRELEFQTFFENIFNNLSEASSLWGGANNNEVGTDNDNSNNIGFKNRRLPNKKLENCISFFDKIKNNYLDYRKENFWLKNKLTELNLYIQKLKSDFSKKSKNIKQKMIDMDNNYQIYIKFLEEQISKNKDSEEKKGEDNKKEISRLQQEIDRVSNINHNLTQNLQDKDQIINNLKNEKEKLLSKLNALRTNPNNAENNMNYLNPNKESPNNRNNREKKIDNSTIENNHTFYYGTNNEYYNKNKNNNNHNNDEYITNKNNTINIYESRQNENSIYNNNNQRNPFFEYNKRKSFSKTNLLVKGNNSIYNNTINNNKNYSHYENNNHHHSKSINHYNNMNNNPNIINNNSIIDNEKKRNYDKSKYLINKDYVNDIQYSSRKKTNFEIEHSENFSYEMSSNKNINNSISPIKSNEALKYKDLTNSCISNNDIQKSNLYLINEFKNEINEEKFFDFTSQNFQAQKIMQLLCSKIEEIKGGLSSIKNKFKKNHQDKKIKPSQLIDILEQVEKLLSYVYNHVNKANDDIQLTLPYLTLIFNLVSKIAYNTPFQVITNNYSITPFPSAINTLQNATPVINHNNSIINHKSQTEDIRDNILREYNQKINVSQNNNNSNMNNIIKNSNGTNFNENKNKNSRQLANKSASNRTSITKESIIPNIQELKQFFDINKYIFSSSELIKYRDIYKGLTISILLKVFKDICDNLKKTVYNFKSEYESDLSELDESHVGNMSSRRSQMITENNNSYHVVNEKIFRLKKFEFDYKILMELLKNYLVSFEVIMKCVEIEVSKKNKQKQMELGEEMNILYNIFEDAVYYRLDQLDDDTIFSRKLFLKLLQNHKEYVSIVYDI